MKDVQEWFRCECGNVWRVDIWSYQDQVGMHTWWANQHGRFVRWFCHGCGAEYDDRRLGDQPPHLVLAYRQLVLPL